MKRLSLSGLAAQVPADHEAVGGGGAQGSAQAAGEQPGGGGHRGDEGRGAGPAVRVDDLDDRAHMQPDPEDAPRHRRRHAALPAAVRHQRCEYSGRHATLIFTTQRD